MRWGWALITLAWVGTGGAAGCLTPPGEGDDDTTEVPDDDASTGDDDTTPPDDDDATGPDDDTTPPGDDDTTVADDDATPPGDDDATVADDDTTPPGDDDTTASDDDTTPPGDDDTTVADDADGDGYPQGIDCDDADPAVHPLATEACNGRDDDCDLTTDEGFDVDGDTWKSCGGDCDDGDPGVHPGATETCDGTDDDCDGVEDDGFDLDGDGATTCGGDCNDADASTHVGAPEACNARDDDCDGHTDEDFDADGDGAPSGLLCPAADPPDCDDSNPDIHPGAPEICNNGLDDDCSGGAPECRLPASMVLDATAPDARLAGENNSDHAGFWVSSSGDVNGDGRADLLIGAPDANGGVGWRGGVTYLFHGPVAGNLSVTAATATWTGGSVDDQVGWSVSIAKDLDGDGFDDVVMGAPGAGLVPLDGGAVYVFRGPVTTGSHAASTADAIITGESASDHAGTAVAGVGDVDGDGFGDLLVSAEDYGEGYEGAVYLMRGPLAGESSLSAADATLVGEAPGDNAGLWISAAGDVNGDGYADLLIGAPFATGGGPDSGVVYLVYGPVWGVQSLSAAGARFAGETGGDEAGMCVASAGDLDGDGNDDLVIGAHKAEGDGGLVSQGGAAYVFYGPVWGPVGLGDAAIQWTGGANQDLAGYAVTGAGDVDGDGWNDLLVAAPYADGGAGEAGATYLVYGPMVDAIQPLSSADAVFRGAAGDDLAGFALASGDVDADGRHDMVIAALGYSGGAERGAVYLLNGRGM